MEKTEKYEFNVKQNTKKPVRWLSMFAVIFWSFFTALALSNVLSPYLSNIISGLLTGIAPLLIGIVIAFIFSKFVDFMENKVLKNAFKTCPFKFGLKRFISIFSVVVIIFGLIILFFAIMVPRIIDVVRELSAGDGDALQQMINSVVDKICLLFQNWFGAEVDQANIKAVLNQLFETLKEQILYLDGVLQLSVSVVTGAFNFLIGVLLAILMLKDKEKISRFTRRFVYANFKKERADEMCVLSRNANKILYDYVICKFMEFFLIVITLGLAYTFLGLSFTWELALIIAVFNFIPYFGIYIGCVPAILITLVFDYSKTLYMFLATFIITSIEFNIIVPFITGNRLNVSSLVVASSIIIGGAMFGMVGLMLAPPIVALINVIISGNIEFKENRMRYLMELQEVREQHDKDQLEVMNARTVSGQSVDISFEQEKNKVKADIDNKNNEQTDKDIIEKETLNKEPLPKEEEKTVKVSDKKEASSAKKQTTKKTTTTKKSSITKKSNTKKTTKSSSTKTTKKVVKPKNTTNLTTQGKVKTVPNDINGKEEPTNQVENVVEENKETNKDNKE